MAHCKLEGEQGELYLHWKDGSVTRFSDAAQKTIKEVMKAYLRSDAARANGDTPDNWPQYDMNAHRIKNALPGDEEDGDWKSRPDGGPA